MSLPARGETSEDRKSLDKIILLALQTAKKAAKLFATSPSVQSDPHLQEVAHALRRRVRKAVKAAEISNSTWLERIELRG